MNSARPKPAAESKAGTPQHLRLLYKVALLIAGPLLLLGLLEAGLRLTGVGYPTGFLTSTKQSGQRVLIQNDKFGWRFFGRDLARQPFPLKITAKKPGSLRVVVFGESAAYGDPQPDFGLPRVLQAMLEQQYPNRQVEVLNAAMTAINSHAILPIARDCARLKADIWVIYMGNNEVVGPYGAGTVFGKPAASVAQVRWTLGLKATRMGQLAERVMTSLQPAPQIKEWGGMGMFLEHQVAETDPRLETVYHNFGENLKDILQLARSAGTKVVLCTAASNLKDCAPFGSQHPPDFGGKELARWETLYSEALKDMEGGNFAAALSGLKEAAELEPSHAAQHFLIGRCYLQTGDRAAAYKSLVRARDLDTLRFRTDSRLNEIIRSTAGKSSTNIVLLADVESVSANLSDGGSPGGEFFVDHVHFNDKGNYALCRAIAEQIAVLVSGTGKERDWPSPEMCARRLGLTDLQRYQGTLAMRGRLAEAPFTAQLNHRESIRVLDEALEKLRPGDMRKAAERAATAADEALKTHPDDWVLLRLRAMAELEAGRGVEAVETWRGVVRRMPHYVDGWRELGRVLAECQRDGEAAQVLSLVLELEPASATALTELAHVRARLGETTEAQRLYRKALELKPHWGPAHLGLGRLLEKNGQPEAAQQHFQQALAGRVYTPGALATLARFCFEKGWHKEAATNFADALRLDPTDAAVHANFGVTLVALGRRAEAREHFEKAVALNPAFSEARIRLGVEYGRQGMHQQALEQFLEAVKLMPDHIEARLNLGIALFNQGRMAEAREQFEEVRRRVPGNVTALKYLQRLGSRD